MAGVLQHLRSSTLNKRPNPASMVDGQIAINYASGSPGAFFKDSNGNLVKVGPVHVGATAPNVSPASGGTAGNSLGEQWLDTSGGTYVFKIWDGAAWRSEAGEFVNVTGDTMTGSLTMGPSANLVFEGSTDDGFETTLTVVDPTADRTITLPNISGTVVTTGDSGTVTSTMIADGTIVNGDVNASAAIAGTKISPDFGSQNVVTTGTSTAASFIPTSSTAPSNGIYLPSANQVAISTSGTGKLLVDASGLVGVGTSSPSSFTPGNLVVEAATTAGITISDSTGGGTASIAFSATPSFQNKAKINCTMSSQSLEFSTATQERLRITSTGTVNIKGAGTAGVTQAVSFNGSAPVDSLVLTSGGLVGIGTSAPLATIDITGAGECMRLQSTTAGANYITHKHNSSGDIAYIGAAGGGALTSGANTDYAIRANQGALLFGTNGNNERARIDSSGRLLVGTSTSVTGVNQPQYAKLQVIGNTLSGARAGLIALGRSEGASTIVAGEQLGGITFGDNAAGEFAYIFGEADGTAGANDYPGRLVFSTTADGASSPTERVLISSSGALLCGRDFRDATHDTNDQFVVQGNGYSARHGLNATAYTIGQNSDARVLRIGSGSGWSTTGVSLAAGGTSWGTYSDERLKTDIVELTNCLDSLKNVRCVSYRLTNVDEADSKKRLGVIAQDLVGKFDEALSAARRSDADETEYLSVQYTDLVPVLIQSLQEAKKRIETLEAKVAALESA